MGYVLWDNVIWLQLISALTEYYLLYCWPSEGGNVDDEEHLTPVVTERNRVSIQGLSREIIDWFIRHACTLACTWDCSQSRVSIQPAILLAHLIHWNITHGSAIVRHDWLHCSPGQRWAGRMVICSTHVLQEEGPLIWWQLIGFGKLNIQNKHVWVCSRTQSFWLQAFLFRGDSYRNIKSKIHSFHNFLIVTTAV